MQESKQFTKVVSLVKMAENVPNVFSPFNRDIHCIKLPELRLTELRLPSYPLREEGYDELLELVLFNKFEERLLLAAWLWFDE